MGFPPLSPPALFQSATIWPRRCLFDLSPRYHRTPLARRKRILALPTQNTNAPPRFCSRSSLQMRPVARILDRSPALVNAHSQRSMCVVRMFGVRAQVIHYPASCTYLFLLSMILRDLSRLLFLALLTPLRASLPAMRSYCLASYFVRPSTIITCPNPLSAFLLFLFLSYDINWIGEAADNLANASYQLLAQ